MLREDIDSVINRVKRNMPRNADILMILRHIEMLRLELKARPALQREDQPPSDSGESGSGLEIGTVVTLVSGEKGIIARYRPVKPLSEDRKTKYQRSYMAGRRAASAGIAIPALDADDEVFVSGYLSVRRRLPKDENAKS